MKKLRETSRHIEAFEAWYECARNYTKTSQHISVNRRTLFDWSERLSWNQRADARDTTVQITLDRNAVKERAKRIEKQLKAGSLLLGKGVGYFEVHEINDEKTAITAIKTGVDIERQADDLPAYVHYVLDLKSDELPSRSEKIKAELRRRGYDERGSCSSVDYDRDETE